jgi:transposase-like protein
MEALIWQKHVNLGDCNMRGKSHPEELKQQIVREVEETGNISLVARNYGVAPTTINGWL